MHLTSTCESPRFRDTLVASTKKVPASKELRLWKRCRDKNKVITGG